MTTALVVTKIASIVSSNLLKKYARDFKLIEDTLSSIRADITMLKESKLNAAIEQLHMAERTTDETRRLGHVNSAIGLLSEAIHLESGARLVKAYVTLISCYAYIGPSEEKNIEAYVDRLLDCPIQVEASSALTRATSYSSKMIRNARIASSISRQIERQNIAASQIFALCFGEEIDSQEMASRIYQHMLIHHRSYLLDQWSRAPLLLACDALLRAERATQMSLEKAPEEHAHIPVLNVVGPSIDKSLKRFSKAGIEFEVRQDPQGRFGVWF